MALVGGLMAVQFLSSLPDGQGVSNTIHLTNGSSSVPSASDLQGVADDLNTYLGTAYKGLLTSASTFHSIIARQVVDPTTTDIYGEEQHSVEAAGTRTPPANETPDQMTGVMQFKTAIVGRRYRGHIFLPPPLDSAVITGTGFGAGTWWSNVGTFLTAVQAGIGPSPTWTGTTLHSWYLCTWSKAAALQGHTAVVAVTKVAVPAKAHWLRSRGRGAT